MPHKDFLTQGRRLYPTSGRPMHVIDMRLAIKRSGERAKGKSSRGMESGRCSQQREAARCGRAEAQVALAACAAESGLVKPMRGYTIQGVAGPAKSNKS